VDYLIKAARTPLEKARAIHKWVTTNIKLVHGHLEFWTVKVAIYVISREISPTVIAVKLII
jgi:hypothetical protein